MSERYFVFDASGEEWAKHAREQLSLFDGGKVEALFFAALALRMGIEARLHEYVEAAAPQKAKDYDAKKLLAELCKRSPHAQKTFTLTFRAHGSSSATRLTYTGVSDALVQAHGKLGDLLHAAFFRNNGDWPYRMRLRDKVPPSRSLLDVRDELEEVALELEKATQGDLLAVRGSMFEGVFKD